MFLFCRLCVLSALGACAPLGTTGHHVLWYHCPMLCNGVGNAVPDIHNSLVPSLWVESWLPLEPVNISRGVVAL